MTISTTNKSYRTFESHIKHGGINKLVCKVTVEVNTGEITNVFIPTRTDIDQVDRLRLIRGTIDKAITLAEHILT